MSHQQEKTTFSSQIFFSREKDSGNYSRNETGKGPVCDD